MEFGETLVAMTAILIGGAVVLIPVITIAIRYALRPLLETWALTRGTSNSDQNTSGLERRISLLEDQVNSLERQNARLIEDADFRMRLESPR